MNRTTTQSTHKSTPNHPPDRPKGLSKHPRVRYRSDNSIELVFSYRADVIESLKVTIPSDSRTWDRAQRTWVIAAPWTAVAIGILKSTFGVVTVITTDRRAA